MSAPSLQSRHSSVPVERPLSAKSGHSNESSQPLAYRVLSDRRSFLVEADSAILISDPREESVLLKRLCRAWARPHLVDLSLSTTAA
jgi:hypothetical protein